MSRMGWVVPGVLACAAALLAVLPPGAAQPRPARAGLVARARELVAASGIGDRVGISVVDARTGEAVFEHRGDEPLKPASNMELIPGAGVVLELGADHRMLTGMYG